MKDVICSCKAGLGRCAHVIGLLYTLAHFQKLGLKSVPPIRSKTSLPQTWHIPQRSLGLTPKPINLVTVNKIKPHQNDPATTSKVQGIATNFYCPVPLPLPSKQFANRLKENLQMSGSTCQLATLMTTASYRPTYVPSPYGEIPKGCVLNHHALPAVQSADDDAYPPFDLPPQPPTYVTVLRQDEHDYYNGMSITLPDAQGIEYDTRSQANTKLWHSVRSQRITATMFKRVCCRKADLDTLASNLTSCKKTVQTQAMRRGVYMEPVAADKYQLITGNSILPCGFVINPSAPHLGATPDRKVIDHSEACPYGLLEIKCPDKEMCADCPYLTQDKEGGLSLKSGHEYQYQMFGQMGLTGAKWCDFFVMSHHDCHLQRLYFDPDMWVDMKQKLDKFYFEHFLPCVINPK